MELILNGLIAALVGATSALVSTYVKEKGKNWATKQDIAEITRNQEAIKLLFEHRKFVTKTQYELELSLYREIWKELFHMQVAVLGLRPIRDDSPPGQSEVEKKVERFNAFSEAFNKVAPLIHYNRPFYSETIYSLLSELLTLCKRESTEYRFHKPRHGDGYWERAQQNQDRIISLIEQAGDAVRKRLESIEVIPSQG